MSTRALTRVNASKHKILCMYRHCDGYPSGHGKELFELLNGMTITNGIQPGKTANGAGCLAAQIVAYFKDGPGSIYLEPPTAKDVGQDYEYTIAVDEETKAVTVTVESGKEKLFTGTVAEFGAFCDKEEN
jgi:hypothetical protein